MKKVMGGVEPATCDDWRTKPWDICWACCKSIHDDDYCIKSSNCGYSPRVVRIT